MPQSFEEFLVLLSAAQQPRARGTLAVTAETLVCIYTHAYLYKLIYIYTRYLNNSLMYAPRKTESAPRYLCKTPFDPKQMCVYLSVYLSTWEFSQNYRYPSEGPFNKDHKILGYILGSPNNYGKLSHLCYTEIWTIGKAKVGGL